MNLLSNLRISHKIILLMVGLTFGFIVIGVIYYVQVTMDRSSRQAERDIHTYQRLLADANRAQLRLRQAANQFLTVRDGTLLGDYDAARQDLERELNRLKNTAADFGAARAVSELETTAAAHDRLFAAAADKLRALGLNQGQGLRASLDRHAASLEKALGAAGSNQALVILLQIRNFERRYLRSAHPDTMATFAQHSMRLDELLSDAQGEDAQGIRTAKKSYTDDFNAAVAVMEQVDRARGALEETAEQLDQQFAQVIANAESLASVRLVEAAEQAQMIQAIVTAIIFSVAMGTAVGIYFIYKSIVFPMAHMQSVIRRINRGKTQARVRQISQDELGDLGQAFNKLLDERIEHLEEQSRENERLNNSIISLITALGTIAKKDLTVKVPVSPDITGTVSDAVNLLTLETARTLHQVRAISEEVNSISERLHDQSRVVVDVADDERRHVIATSRALETAARAMNDIAQRALNADELARDAIANTRSARSTVLETVGGIRAIRETISETEKRMKRLGDRSQEISGIVNLINTIAERTHILALNASMHAASAGEAGKGFAVVADEVQRLAENAREATAEISSMVNNIRVETSDTVAVMNTLIAQVADGSRLAEQAGKRMDDTERATTQLVENVKIIAESSSQQAELANKVRDRAIIIRRFTEKTGQQLDEQKRYTDSLKRYAATLVERVNVFTLPESARTAVELVPIAAPGSEVEAEPTVA